MSDKTRKSGVDEPAGDQAPDPLLDLLRPLVQNQGDMPTMIRRYRVLRRLGSGTFGDVFLARDDQLQRDVAIKVPTSKFLDNAANASTYLEEARVIAGLEHPNIIPVYDVGSTYDFPCFIVTRFVEGNTLDQFVKKKKISQSQALKLIATIARALHYAHQQGVVHRDIKPQNILIDGDGKPFVVDLGLALTENNDGEGPNVLGTPAYMSPEQARGEGHRVDGRTDVYSLGVILYELLLGRRPFTADSGAALLEKVVRTEPKPPRQIDDHIDKELERICLKCLEKRASDRYTTARDLADDLIAFLQVQTVDDQPSSILATESSKGSSRISTVSETGSSEDSARGLPSVIPKGLRAFDGNDADFFLRLLPGAVDREGLPESVRFWKQRIEPGVGKRGFDVGVLFGPSGSGKSSLIQAGVLPHLSKEVRSIVVECNRTDTESRLLQALVTNFPDLDATTDLPVLFQRLRKDSESRRHCKLLLVFDQFEQWLHAHSRQLEEPQLPVLAHLLRQCDGQALQAILLVRDDFWMSITKFMKAIEVPLAEGSNTSSIDLFDEKHAARTLHLFGSAYGKLPVSGRQLSNAENVFLARAVDEITIDGQTGCIKVALLAEILKNKSWTSESLEDLGGIQGIGVRYLEQTFDSSSALPHFRHYAEPVQKILTRLLPDDTMSIRGNRVSADSLAESCGLSVASEDWAEVVKILDHETRILTPVDTADAGQPQYQLTHDYLVPSIRAWIQRKMSQSREGRAQILLQDLSDAWNAKPESRRLPGPVELFQLHRRTPRQRRTAEQKKMLRRANRFYLVRASLLLVASVLVGSAVGYYFQQVQQQHRIEQRDSLVKALYAAPLEAIPYATENLKPIQSEAIEQLEREFANPQNESTQFRAAIALSLLGNVPKEYLISKILENDTQQTRIVMTGLRQDPEGAVEALLQKCESEELSEPQKRLLLMAQISLGEFRALPEIAQIDSTPEDRSQLIVQLGNWPHDWKQLQELLESEDAGIRSAVILGLGQVEMNQVPAPVRKQMIRRTGEIFQQDPRAVVHSAAKYLLEHWGQPLPRIQTLTVNEKSEWLETPSGHTLIRFNRPEKFKPKGLNYFIRVAEEFWISDSEVTCAQFMKFYTDPETPLSKKPLQWIRFLNQDGSNADSVSENRAMSVGYRRPRQPVDSVNIQDAIFYCNWLSRREGLQPCYRNTGNKYPVKWGRETIIPEGDDYRLLWVWHLNPEANGYRLPTFPEYMLVQTGGSEQHFAFGVDPELVPHFALNASPVSGMERKLSEDIRLRLPDNYGLFNVQGNVSEWAHQYPNRVGELIRKYGKNSVGLIDRDLGGNWRLLPEESRKANRSHRASSARDENIGFRIMRRLTSASSED